MVGIDPPDRPPSSNSRSSCCPCNSLAAGAAFTRRRGHGGDIPTVISRPALPPSPLPAPPRPRACSGTSRRPPSRPASSAPLRKGSSCGARAATRRAGPRGPRSARGDHRHTVARAARAASGQARGVFGSYCRVRREPVAMHPKSCSRLPAASATFCLASSSKWRSEAPGSFPARAAAVGEALCVVQARRGRDALSTAASPPARAPPHEPGRPLQAVRWRWCTRSS